MRRLLYELYHQPHTHRDEVFRENEEYFLSHIPQNNLTEEMELKLAAQLTKQDLYDALKSLKIDKSPGLDSLTVEFYRAYWPHIKDLIYFCLFHRDKE